MNITLFYQDPGRVAYNFEDNSQSEFKDWAPDVVNNMVGNIMDVWKDYCINMALLDEMTQFVDNLES